MKNTAIKLLESSLETDPFASLDTLETVSESGKKYNLWAMPDGRDDKKEPMHEEPDNSSDDGFEGKDSEECEGDACEEEPFEMPRGHQTENAFGGDGSFSNPGDALGMGFGSPDMGMGMDSADDDGEIRVHTDDVLAVVKEAEDKLKAIIKKLGSIKSSAVAGIKLRELKELKEALAALDQVNINDGKSKSPFDKKEDKGSDSKKSSFGKKEEKPESKDEDKDEDEDEKEMSDPSDSEDSGEEKKDFNFGKKEDKDSDDDDN